MARDKSFFKSKGFLGLFLAAILCLAPTTAMAQGTTNYEKIDGVLAEFRDDFYISEDLKFKYDLFEYRDFVMQETLSDEWNSGVALVTHFEPRLVQSKLLKDINSLEEAESYIDSKMKLHSYRGLEIPELSFELLDGNKKSYFWIGQKTYPSLSKAKSALDGFAKKVAKQGVNFTVFVKELLENGVPFEEPEEIILEEGDDLYGGALNVEEAVALYVWEKMDLQRYSGKDADEPWFVWQSVFESTYRSTNFSRGGYSNIVGFFANRIRVRGMKMPYGSSLDPFIEGINAFTTEGTEFDNNWVGRMGMEWRPFRGFKSLDKHWYTSWIKNIRGHIDYANRFAVKDPITGSPDHDWSAGVDVFKEWGIEIPEEGKPDFWWGEYFGTYNFHKTNFSFIGQDNGYNAFLANTRILLGFKYPRIPLPDNPMNNQVVLMPYMGWEWINNNHLDLFFENKYVVFAGLRWMPFRNKRHEKREWLYKMKLFFEYVGIGHIQHTKSHPEDADPAFDVNNDFRFGVNISSNRF